MATVLRKPNFDAAAQIINHHVGIIGQIQAQDESNKTLHVWLEDTNLQQTKKMFTLLDLCVSSLRRGHAKLLCLVPILTDDLRGASKCVKK